MLLEGKRALVFGVANKRSIAWAIAQSLHREGAELAFTFQGERIEAGVRDLASSVGSSLVLPCDVQRDEEIERVFGRWRKEQGELDILVHALAFARRELFEERGLRRRVVLGVLLDLVRDDERH